MPWLCAGRVPRRDLECEIEMSQGIIGGAISRKSLIISTPSLGCSLAAS